VAALALLMAAANITLAGLLLDLHYAETSADRLAAIDRPAPGVWAPGEPPRQNQIKTVGAASRASQSKR